MALNTIMTKYIFESPDGGKTVYRREPGEQRRELIKEPTSVLLEAQRLYEWKHIFKKANTDSELRELIDRVEVFYRLKYAKN